ncbi:MULTISPECIES: hypothetical protein [Streptomyces]|uniref:SagB/ThcOx family dehydrogenase n=1 Tax=Streptomyces luteosporeus TaxID=173856 RepID=A0ABP6G2H4_9ACTN
MSHPTHPPSGRVRALREILGARPSGDTRRDPQAAPHLNPVRRAVAGAAAGRDLPAPQPRWDLLDELPWPQPGPQRAVDLADVVATACAPVRFETDNPYPEHRPYPSPRAKFPVRVVADGQLLAPEADAYLPLPQDVRPQGRAIETGSALRTLPGFYGPLRRVLAGLETGHLLASVALLGAALGRPVEVTGRAGEQWAGWLEALTGGEVVPGYRMTDAVPPASAGPAGSGPSWARTVWARNSGRVPRGYAGFTATRTTVPGDAFRRALAALSAAGTGLGVLAQARSVLHLYCWVRGVEGLRDGLYRVDGTEAHRVGDCAPASGGLLIDAAPVPSLAFDLDRCTMVWMFVADLDAAAGLQATGAGSAGTDPDPDPARVADDVLAATGWLAQHLSLAAAAHGMFARPLRSFHGDRAADALGLPPHHQAIYQLACGVGRFDEPGLDARPTTLEGATA